MEKQIKIALAGNPNCGKTTLFNALTGSNQFVGNWPGVTVEKKEGKLKKHDNVVIMDLPGIYSLSPYTLEEVVARNYLVGERPDAILNIIDGTNLERNLYLTTQLTELGIPVVIAINMMDIVRKNGDEINVKELFRVSGIEIDEISALKGDGVMEFGLRRAQGPDAGLYGARAAMIGGCVGTSNVLAGKMFDVPVLGTNPFPCTPSPALWSTPSPTSKRRPCTPCRKSSSAGTQSRSLSATTRCSQSSASPPRR